MTHQEFAPNWRDDEIRVMHVYEATDAAALFLDGFNLLLDGLHGYNFGEHTEQRVMVALFIKTLNSFRCFYELATCGYFVQALNLMRTPPRRLDGLLVPTQFLERHNECTDAGLEPPEFNVALQAVESHSTRN